MIVSSETLQSASSLLNLFLGLFSLSLSVSVSDNDLGSWVPLALWDTLKKSLDRNKFISFKRFIEHNRGACTVWIHYVSSEGQQNTSFRSLTFVKACRHYISLSNDSNNYYYCGWCSYLSRTH